MTTAASSTGPSSGCPSSTRTRSKPRAEPGAGGRDETRIAAPEPGGVELVHRAGLQVRCPEGQAARTHKADPQVDPPWRTVRSHRPDASAARRADPLAAHAPAGRGSAHGGWD